MKTTVLMLVFGLSTLLFSGCVASSGYGYYSPDPVYYGPAYYGRGYYGPARPVYVTPYRRVPSSHYRGSHDYRPSPGRSGGYHGGGQPSGGNHGGGSPRRGR